MFKCLNCGMIGLEVDPIKQVELAGEHGFEGVDLPIVAIDQPGPVAEALDRLGLQRGSAGGLITGKTGVPDAEWDEAMKHLPARAKLAAELGFTRTTSVVLPFHEELDFDACFDLHRKRLAEAAPVLADHGIRLGLEYVSQKTRRAGYKNAFVYNLSGLMRVIEACNQPNLGVLLDSFHWHCAGEGVGDIKPLGNAKIVVVHVNDAIAERSVDEQVAFERELPGDSGVIDLAGFVAALRDLGYDGPLTAEPMNQALNASARDEKLSRTSQSLSRLSA